MHPLRFFVLFIFACNGKPDALAKAMTQTTECKELQRLYRESLRVPTIESTYVVALDAAILPFLHAMADCGILAGDEQQDEDVSNSHVDLARLILTPRIADDDNSVSGLMDIRELSEKTDYGLDGQMRLCDIESLEFSSYPLSIRHLVHKIILTIPSGISMCSDLRAIYQLFLANTEPQLSNTKKRGKDESAIIRDALLQLNSLSSLWQRTFALFERSSEFRSSDSKMITIIKQALISSERAMTESAKNAIFLLYNTENLENAFMAMLELYVFYSRRLSLLNIARDPAFANIDFIILLGNSVQNASSLTTRTLESFTFNKVAQTRPVREDRDRLMRFYTLIEDVSGARPDLAARCLALAGYTKFAQSVYNEDALQLEQYPFLTMSLARAFSLCDLAQTIERRELKNSCLAQIHNTFDKEVCRSDLYGQESDSVNTEPIQYQYASKLFDFLTYNGYSDNVPMSLKTGQFFGSSQMNIRPLSIGTYRWTEHFSGQNCEEPLQSVREGISKLPDNLWKALLFDQIRTIPDAEDVAMCLHLSILRLMSDLVGKCSDQQTAEASRSSRDRLNDLDKRWIQDIRDLEPIIVAFQKRAWEYWQDRNDILTHLNNPKVHETTASFLKSVLHQISEKLKTTADQWKEYDDRRRVQLEAVFDADHKLYEEAVFTLGKEYLLMLYRSLAKMVLFLNSLDEGREDQYSFGAPLVLVETAEIVDTAGALLAEKIGTTRDCLNNFKEDAIEQNSQKEADMPELEPVESNDDDDDIPQLEPTRARPVRVDPRNFMKDRLQEIDLREDDKADAEDIIKADDEDDTELNLQVFDEFFKIMMNPVLHAEILWDETNQKPKIKSSSSGLLITESPDEHNVRVCANERLINKPNICITIDEDLIQMVTL